MQGFEDPLVLRLGNDLRGGVLVKFPATCHRRPDWAWPVLSYVQRTRGSIRWDDCEFSLISGDAEPYKSIYRNLGSDLWFVSIGWLMLQDKNAYACACAEILDGACRMYQSSDQ